MTRFAPSPTGELHLGNARTALFNFLLARRAGGRFLLRIEDTDAQRSQESHLAVVLEDLRWLGLDWDAGPDREDGRGPYRQSQRGALYARFFEMLERQEIAYPCFCTPLELEASRRAQLGSGRPPRYAGTCRELSAEQRRGKRAQGLSATLRFRVPAGRRIEFADLVHGPQSFLSDDIGDFIVRRADGTAAFFFCNAVDDASMDVTHVLRGEDHLANTPRQLLILEALSLRAPSYGHVSLILGSDGAPLSKRHGATSVREYRESGYRPEALVNHLFRLGHSSGEHGLLDFAAMARAFDPAHLGRSSAHFDAQQLRVWQKEAAHRLSPGEARAWLAPVLPADLSDSAASAFIAAVLPNVVLPEDAQPWAGIVFGPPPALEPEGEEIVRKAGEPYFAAAAQAAAQTGNDLPAIAAAVRAATGKKGAELYMPLRLALTGRSHGPELAPLLKAMPAGAAQARLARFA
ncbi:MAG TPA: glutamate--tRNA ligase [Steroidobacteraceae bacterium]|nr:glutamate--tRNA ligase [Steroidobacteraceae bacterium]